MIDIESLMVRRMYKIGMPPQDVFSQLDDVFLTETHVPGEKDWWIDGFRGDRFCRYVKNLVCVYVARNSSIDESESKLIEMVDKVYNENLFTEALEGLRDDLPHSLDIIIKKVNGVGCECEVLCYSVLYEKLNKGILDEDDVNYVKEQSCKHQCERFLDQILIGILGGTEIEEKITQDWMTKLLINDSSTRDITDMIDALLDDATTEVLICGWVGTYFLPKLRQLASQGVNVKFMTRRPGEAKGQPWRSEIEEARRDIISDFGLEAISDAHNVHGRTLIVDNKALIGSMDLNSASLTGAHTEFCILTDNPDIVRRLRAVFHSKFEPLKTSG